MVCGVRAVRNRRADAAAVTGSRVCAESMVEIRTSKGSSWLSSAIFSTAGNSRWPMARASARMTARTCTLCRSAHVVVILIDGRDTADPRIAGVIIEGGAG